MRLPACDCAGYGSTGAAAGGEGGGGAACAYRAAVDAALRAEAARPLSDAGASPLSPTATSELWCEQLVGRAGDVVLMHPLTLHSGTTNCGVGKARLMANGMAVVDAGAFDAAGGTAPLLALARQAAAEGGGGSAPGAAAVAAS